MKNPKFPEEGKKLHKTVMEKPVRKSSKKKEKTLVFDEENAIWEVPKKLSSFQRPKVVKMKELGDSIDGIYEGLQPVEYKQTGNVGAIMLLRQRDNSLCAITASYDIRRFLDESGFGDMIGEYINITLEDFVDTSDGKFAPMKQFSFEYDEMIVSRLAGGRNYTFTQLPMGKSVGEKLISEVSEVPGEKWEK